LVSDLVDDTIVSPNVLEMETKGYGTVIACNTGSEDESGRRRENDHDLHSIKWRLFIP